MIPRGERGVAMIALLAAVLIVTMISIALIGVMTTDLTHASIQFAVARSFYIAQAGLVEAKVQLSAAADPTAYATPARGVTMPYGSGRFIYWVDAGPADGCGPGLKTLEAQGEVGFLGRTIWSRVRACAVGGTPFMAALFGAARVQFQGEASRVYLAPYRAGTPGGGGSLGSFTEVNFADTDTRLNALSEATTDTVTLRDGAFADYELFGFPTRPDYNPAPMTDPAPWISSVFGEIIKAQPTTGFIPNRCGTPYACVTVADNITDIRGVPELREARYVRHVYADRIREEVLPQLSLDPETFRAQASRNTANAWLNKTLGFPKDGSAYELMEFYRIVAYLVAHPSRSLEGTIFVDGSFQFIHSVNLGNITLVVRGDLIVDSKATLMVKHDLSTVAGRRAPGIVVFGFRDPVERLTNMCEGQRVNGSGRMVLCSGTTLTVDGLIYTQDGMAVEPGAFVDQIGALYHNNRGTENPSFTTQNATVVLRFDPLALSVFGKGSAILSWQQLHGPAVVAPAPASPLATAPSPSAPTTATPLSGPEPPAVAVPPPAASPPAVLTPPTVTPGPGSAPPAAASRNPAHESPRPTPGPRSTPAPVVASGGTAQAAHPASTPMGLVGRHKFHVQAGAFRNREYADDLVQRLRAHGYNVTLAEGALIRVWVGPPIGLDVAERLAAKIRADGFEAVLNPAP